MATDGRDRIGPGRGAVDVRSAGGVVYRSRRSGAVEVAVIRQRGSGGWSLPKGKLNQGETPEQAALREVEEETGLRCQLLRPLESSSYVDRRGRQRVVFYWLMRRLRGRFRPSDEVSELRWLRPGQAMGLLSSERDRAALRRAETAGPLRDPWAALGRGEEARLTREVRPVAAVFAGGAPRRALAR